MYAALSYIQPMMERVMNKKTGTGLRSKWWLQIEQTLDNLKGRFNLKNKKYQRKSKRRENKSRCSFRSEKLPYNPFQNQWWTTINVKEPLNNNFNISKLISVWDKSKKSSKKKKAELYKSLKGSKKNLGEIKTINKEKALILLLKRRILLA